jgi:hypothetical protein
MVQNFPTPKIFLDAARKHQHSWLQKQLHLKSTDETSVLLPPKAAYVGQNFFDDAVYDLVKKRFENSFKPNKDGNPRRLISDGLRSEHIPFNLFGPLVNQLDSDNVIKFFSALAGVKFTTIDDIEFEYSPPPAHEILNDHTAFDVYITARKGERPYAIGVEVKYTEGSYSWGDKEQERMEDPQSIYNILTQEKKEFTKNAAQNLCNIHLKQIWRNFLLGIVTENPQFIFVHLYPEGNTHQTAVCKKFNEQLSQDGRSIFRSTTYENFLAMAKKDLNSILSPWIEYIEARYIV